MCGSSSRRLPSIQLARISCVHWNWFRPSSLQGGVAMMIKNNSHSRRAGWAAVLSNWHYMSLASSNLEEKLPNNPTVRSLSTFYKHTIKLQSLRKSTSVISQLQYYYDLLSSFAPSSSAAINQKPHHNIRIIWISSDWFHRRGGCCCYEFSRWGGTSHLWELLCFDVFFYWESTPIQLMLSKQGPNLSASFFTIFPHPTTPSHITQSLHLHKINGRMFGIGMLLEYSTQ